MTDKQLTKDDYGTRVRTPNGYTGTTRGPTEFGDSYVAVSLDIISDGACAGKLASFPISKLTIIGDDVDAT